MERDLRAFKNPTRDKWHARRIPKTARIVARERVFWPFEKVPRGLFLEALAELNLSARKAFSMLESWEHCHAPRGKDARARIASPSGDLEELIPITHSDLLFLQESLLD